MEQVSVTKALEPKDLQVAAKSLLYLMQRAPGGGLRNVPSLPYVAKS